MRLLSLSLMCAAVVVAAPVPEPTFYKDVLPVLEKNCQGCHRPGEAAPRCQPNARRQSLCHERPPSRLHPPLQTFTPGFPRICFRGIDPRRYQIKLVAGPARSAVIAEFSAKALF